MLDRDFTRKIKLLNGREELVTVRWEASDNGFVEHITLEVPGRSVLSETSNRLRKLRLVEDAS